MKKPKEIETEETTTIRITKTLKGKLFDTKGDEISYNDFVEHLLNVFWG